MDYAKFRANFVSAIDGLDDAAVGMDTKFHDLELWDSLAIICILAMIDSEYSVSLTAAELNSAETVLDLAKLVEKKMA